MFVFAHVPSSWGLRGCTYGATNPLAAVNGTGETLIAWQEVTSGASEYEEEKVCDSAVAPVAVGSPQTGFTDMGPLSAPGRMSAPTGAILDDAGSGWVIGVHNAVTGENKYGLDWGWTGAWLAFRPAGARFRSAVKLPGRGLLADPPLVAGNRAGAALFAWDTVRGSYVAWGTPSGTITTPRFFGHRFRVAGIGVNERGQALIIGHYTTRESLEDATSIVAITGQAYGAFSTPRAIATEPRNARGRVTSLFERPLVGIGPTGSAVIVWETWRELPRESPGPGLLVYRYADGHFTRPRQIPKEFLDLGIATTEATVDADGRALIVHDSEHSWREVAVMPGGRLGPEWSLPESFYEPSLAGNELGQTVIGKSEIGKKRSITAILGDTSGAPTTSQTFALPHEVSGGFTMTIDRQGDATAIWIEKSQQGTTVVHRHRNFRFPE